MVWLPLIATFGRPDVAMGMTLTFTYLFVTAAIFSILSADGFFGLAKEVRGIGGFD